MFVASLCLLSHVEFDTFLLHSVLSIALCLGPPAAWKLAICRPLWQPCPARRRRHPTRRTDSDAVAELQYRDADSDAAAADADVRRSFCRRRVNYLSISLRRTRAGCDSYLLTPEDGARWRRWSDVYAVHCWEFVTIIYSPTRTHTHTHTHTHIRLLSDAPVFQPSAIELFRSPLPGCGTLCRWASRRRRQCLFSL